MLQLKQKYSICTILLRFRFNKQLNTRKSAPLKSFLKKRTSACNLLLLQTSCIDLVCKSIHAFIHDGNLVCGHKNEGLFSALQPRCSNHVYLSGARVWSSSLLAGLRSLKTVFPTVLEVRLLARCADGSCVPITVGYLNKTEKTEYMHGWIYSWEL